jgi:uncharacterized protein YndB with AHSA1/START domain
MSAAIDSPVLEITRIFDAPPARVFAAWLTKEEWAAWIGPEGVRCDAPLFEPRVGGRYRLIMHRPVGGDLTVVGIFKAIEAEKSFAFSWRFEGDARETLVTVTLRDLGGRTQLTLRHEGLPDAADREGHGKGWSSALNKLAAYLAARRPGSAP